MVMRDGSTLINRGPSPRAPVTFGRSPQPPAGRALEQGLVKQMNSLRNAVVEVIKGTEWPLESKEAAMGLIDTVESPPGIPQNMNVIPQDIQDIIKEYVQVLEDVYTRLKDASSKSGIKNWKIFQTIRLMASKRPSRCTLLFQTCQHDLAQTANDLRERMDSERSKGAFGPPQEQVQLTAPSAQQLGPLLSNTKSNPEGYAAVPPSPMPSTRNSLSHGFQDEESGGPVQGEVLNIARKAFKAVEIASGSIPVAGSFVAAAAKVGLAFVETIQTMDKNDSLAVDLGAQTAKLSKLLANLMEQPNGDHGELIADHITALHKELHHAHDKVTRWKSLGRFDKAFHSRDHAELLKAYQGTIQTALEELQLLVSLDTRNMTIELRNAEAQEQKRRLLDRLGDGKYGAQGNTIEDVVCFPGTRVQILKKIDNWIRDSSTSDRVLWIRGMAGRGKSTIASTVVHGWKCRASCAIFHFRRGQNKVNTRFVCTLARQLGSSLVLEVKNAILDSVRENQDIANQRLEEQFKALVVAPLSKMNGQGHPILIVIDALDECDNPKDAVDFVWLIDQHSQSLPANVKFLLTCRPEAPLIRTLEPKKWHVEDLETASDVSDDLERFIRQAFKQIRDSDSKLPEDWPLSKDVRQLVEMSQGLFQWARTAITYIGDGSPVNRLRVLLKRPSMWSGLDDLYHQILSKAFDSVKLDPSRRDLLCRVLGTVIVAPYPISLEVIASLFGKHEMFEGTSQEDIIQFLREDILADLNSLLSISSPAEPVHLMHTSIRDLLTSHNRCEQRPYYIDPIRYHQQLANLCLEIMLGGLKENVCNLFDISQPSSEVQDIMEREVSKAVQYSCRSWSIHLTEGTKLAEMGTDDATVNLANFETFSKEKLMYWLEVMSLVGATTEAIGMATRVYQWLLQRPGEALEHNSLAMLWSDVQRFISTFWEPISFGPLHVYASSLSHCPVKAELFGLFGKHAKVRTLRGLQSPNWPASLWERPIGSEVMTVVFSPDGRIVASGSNDGTIQLWEPQTGMAVGEPIMGHSNSVRTLCFSPDGKVLASGSVDKTIRLWDPHTRAAVCEPLTAHDGSFNSVCFSPDGTILASGSDDTIIRFWDPHTGAAVGEPLTSHRGSVTSLCFSPDGKLLASGSNDRTIRLWDTQTGAAVGELVTSKIYWVNSVCFSPDGKILAVGSNDETVQLWDPQTRTAVGEALTGHSGFVKSVCFSPDGNILASGSRDGTIRFWDPRTRAAVGEPLTSYKTAVNSVCFSPDGKVLASGSMDETIRLWDPHTRAAVGESLTAHDDSFNSVLLSPNGKILASGSNDGAIQLWDSHTGAAVGEPLTNHSRSVTSLCFSPDSKILASGSDGQKIQLWDPYTGAAVGELVMESHRSVTSLCFSPDGKILASGFNNRRIQLWDPYTGADNSQIQLWDPHTGAAVGKLAMEPHRSVTSLCFSPDGKILASGSNNRKIKLWDPHTGAAVGELVMKSHRSVTSLCFSPDGKLLACGTDYNTVQLWDLQTGTAVGGPLTGHMDGVTSVHFSSDGMLLMARYRDGSSATWDMITYQRCNVPRTPLNDASPAFQDHWVTLFCSPFFWLPPQYWGTARREIILSGGTLFVLYNQTLSIFDVSQALGLTR